MATLNNNQIEDIIKSAHAQVTGADDIATVSAHEVSATTTILWRTPEKITTSNS